MDIVFFLCGLLALFLAPAVCAYNMTTEIGAEIMEKEWGAVFINSLVLTGLVFLLTNVVTDSLFMVICYYSIFMGTILGASKKYELPKLKA